MKARYPLVVGLDIGTTKICVVVAGAEEIGINILGVGTHPSKGLRKGVIINIETTVTSIKRALDDAALMSGGDIQSVYASISGGHIKSFNSHGMVALRGAEVMSKDVDRVREAASAVAIPTDREILHVLPYEYIVDEQRGIRDPIGMTGVRLEVNCHIVTAAASSISNTVKCANEVGLHVDEVVFGPFASALPVLTEQERDVGAVVVDIGGGTSDIAVFHEGAMVHSAVLALGGGHITNDIAHGLRVTAYPTAENLKVKYGSALAADIDPHEDIEIQEAGAREQRWIARQILCEIIEQRCDEILRLIRSELEDAGYLDVAQTGLVITGGCANLPGIERLAEHVFNTHARIGVPTGITGHVDLVGDPGFASAVGLAVYGKNNMKGQKRKPGSGVRIDKTFTKVKEWLKEFF